MLGISKAGPRGLEASPLAHAQGINEASSDPGHSRAGVLPGLSRKAGNLLHGIRAVPVGGGWDRDMSTRCGKESSLPGLSTATLNLPKSSGAAGMGPTTHPEPAPSLTRELGLTHVTKMG